MKRFIACLWLAILLAPIPAAAQTWPDRPIKLIVPTGVGSATDVMARLLAAEVSKGINGSIFVENIAGASGIPAHSATARSTPDGYTFLFTNSSGLALNLFTFKQIPYDPNRDFVPVAVVADLAPQMVSVHKDVPAKTLPELIAWVKANPGKVSFGFDATAGAAVFFGKLLNRRAELDMAEVPYRSAAQLVQDAAAGRFQVLVSSMVVANPFVQKGDLRRIAVFSSRRFPTIPDVPTVSETLARTAYDGWFMVVAPSGTPPAIVARMNKEIAEALKRPDMKEKLHSIGLDISAVGPPAEALAMVAREQQNWGALTKELGVEPQ